MGRYTELEAQLTLKNCEETQELLAWIKTGRDNTNNVQLDKLKDFEFFKLSRRYWFNFDVLSETREHIIISISANLKNYEDEIAKLYKVLKPYYIEGYYKSLYEEMVIWFDHTESNYESEGCVYCGEVDCDTWCQY